ncbi:unnamed protein product [Thelazia callipaeda]|uniref:TFIIS N-terminal domain-containing protein n=1 Tax=Thelazia callipaeda TaxID=103827 RepID=A0A0N5D857_THECL|nr:unnamed protein product [Thelazia callipaeda]
MPDSEPIRRFVPLPTQFLQEEEPSEDDDNGDVDEQDFQYHQHSSHFQHSPSCMPSDHSKQTFTSTRGIPSNTFYGTSQRNSYGQVPNEIASAHRQRNFPSRSFADVDDASEDSYHYREVFDDPHQLIPSYHEYSITSSPTEISGGMPEYFVSRGASSVIRPGSLGYGSQTDQQGETTFYESQQRLQEPKVISNESNRYTVVGHTVEGQPIYALQSVRPRSSKLQQRSLYRVVESSTQPRYVFLRQPISSTSRPLRDGPESSSCSENYRAVAREIVARALEEKRHKQHYLQDGQPSSSGTSSSIPKTKRKTVVSEDEGTGKISDSTVAAQVAAIQRFSTPLGWKQMGSWLKAAEASEDWNRLKLLLSQCAQANLTLDLLQSNDTPRFVRKLSKTCPDQDVRKVSGDLVLRWKRLIATPPPQSSEGTKKVGSAKRKTPHPVSVSANKIKKKEKQDISKNVEEEVESEGSEVSGSKVETKNKSLNSECSEQLDRASTSVNKPVKISSLKIVTNKVNKAEKSSESAKVVSEKLNEFNMFEKLGEGRKEKKPRPKTAKTYTSKFRSTGLEGDDDVASTKNSTNKAPLVKKKGSLPSKGLLDAKKRTAMPPNVSKVLTNIIPSSAPVTSSALPEKKSMTTTPARVMMSNTFMDALMDPGNKKTPSKQAKKRLPPSAKPPTSVMPSVMEGLYSDTSKSLNKDNKEKQDEEVSEKNDVVEEPDIVLSSNRKIRFADEHGQELVEIRYFEVEEGERLNVSKLSSEDMKHLEMQRERTFMKEQRSLHTTEFGFNSNRIEGTTHILWKLIPLDNAVCFEGRGSLSEAKKIEEERQKTVMMPFYDPSLCAELAEAEPDLSVEAILPPLEIPLEPESTDDDQIEDVTQAVLNATISTGILPDQSQEDMKEIDVQKLMSELKKKGLVGSSCDLANILNKVPSAPTTTTEITASSLDCSMSAINTTTTATYAQLTVHPNMPNMSLPPPRFAQGLPMPPMLANGQFMLPIQPQQPLLNGPVPAGVTPTVGVDLTIHSGPSTSEAPSYGTCGRPHLVASKAYFLAIKQCTFYQSGTCSYGFRCRFAHGDEPTAGTQSYGYGDERGKGFRRGNSSFRGIPPRRGVADGGYRRGRGNSSFTRRGFYDRDRDRGRDRDRECDHDRRLYDRYQRRRRRSWSRSKSRSRSRSKSPTPLERRAFSPDNRKYGGTREFDQEERFEKRYRSDDREREDERIVSVQNRLGDEKLLLSSQNFPGGQYRMKETDGFKSLTKDESVMNIEQQKLPPGDSLTILKLGGVQEPASDSPASPTED